MADFKYLNIIGGGKYASTPFYTPNKGGIPKGSTGASKDAFFRQDGAWVAPIIPERKLIAANVSGTTNHESIGVDAVTSVGATTVIFDPYGLQAENETAVGAGNDAGWVTGENWSVEMNITANFWIKFPSNSDSRFFVGLGTAAPGDAADPGVDSMSFRLNDPEGDTTIHLVNRSGANVTVVDTFLSVLANTVYHLQIKPDSASGRTAYTIFDGSGTQLGSWSVNTDQPAGSTSLKAYSYVWSQSAGGAGQVKNAIFKMEFNK